MNQQGSAYTRQGLGEIQRFEIQLNEYSRGEVLATQQPGSVRTS